MYYPHILKRSRAERGCRPRNPDVRWNLSVFCEAQGHPTLSKSKTAKGKNKCAINIGRLSFTTNQRLTTMNTGRRDPARKKCHRDFSGINEDRKEKHTLRVMNKTVLWLVHRNFVFGVCIPDSFGAWEVSSSPRESCQIFGLSEAIWNHN